MALNQRLELRQGQSLVMTPQLQQAIKLLQMSNLEVQAYVDAELERNPLLDRDDAQDAPVERDAAPEPEIGRSESLEPEGGAVDNDLGQENLNADDSRADVQNAQPQGQSDSGWASLGAASPSGFERGEFNLEDVLSSEPTLSEHLTDQLALALADPAERLIGAQLIGMVDETGYLRAELDEVAEMLGTSILAVQQVLEVLQGFDPAGVFARDLKECLALQLKAQNRYDPAMAAMVENLELLARRDYVALKRVCGVDLDDLKEMAAEIRRLDPKPGNAFGELVVQPVVPDVTVRQAPDGTWSVELNSETLPRLLVNNQYHAVVSARSRREDDKLYISECFSNAQWLVKSLDQRARTILTVAREIVRQQDAFLVEGVQALRPLNLRTIAEAIGMHESTVSRVTSNKYMATPRGIVEMKYFFTTAITAVEGGDAHSAEAVRHRIRQMVDSERGQTVLSDDMIVDQLRQAGIEIARRTVAKYRESLGIPSSVQRRRERRAYA